MLLNGQHLQLTDIDATTELIIVLLNRQQHLYCTITIEKKTKIFKNKVINKKNYAGEVYFSQYNNKTHYRFLRNWREFLLSQAALREPPFVCENLCPLPKPREDLPAEVLPRSSLCLWTAFTIQFTFGSRRIAWNMKQ